MQNLIIGFIIVIILIIAIIDRYSTTGAKSKKKTEEYEAIIDNCGFSGRMWTLKNTITGKVLEDVWDCHSVKWESSRTRNTIGVGLTPLPAEGSRRYRIVKKEFKDGSVQVNIFVSPKMDPTPKAVGTIIVNAINRR